MSAKMAAIVDPYSTGVHLSEEFQKHGWDCVAVIHRDVVPHFADDLRPNDFRAVIRHDDDIAATLAQLQRFPVAAVVAGAETGVVLADHIAAGCGVAGNDPTTSRNRRDKAAMVQALQEARLPAPRSQVAASLAEATAWATTHDTWPVVLKPVDAAASNGVHYCYSIEELAAAWKRTFRQRNVAGVINEVLLVQEFLSGPQFVVNTVSRDGAHYVQGIWQDYRVVTSDGRRIYDYTELLPCDYPENRRLSKYVYRVLTALGIVHGAAHTEVVITDRGPVLVESGARLMGADPAAAEVTATGESQLAVAVEAIVTPDRFRRRIGAAYPYRQPLVIACLAAPFDARLNGAVVEAVRALPTVANVIGPFTGGRRVPRTVDLDTCPALVQLTGAAHRVADDLSRIRAFERSGLYQPETGEIHSSTD